MALTEQAITIFMAKEKRSRMPETVKELRPHIIWDAIKGIGGRVSEIGGAGVITASVALAQRLMHRWDILVIVVTFIASFVIMLIGKRGRKGRESYQEDSLPRPFSTPNIFVQAGNPGLYIGIWPGNPGMFINRYRSEVEVQLIIFSTASIEWQFVKADLICNSTNVTTLVRNEPVAIPQLNPQSQMIKKDLTEKELQRFGSDQSQWFDISGTVKFRDTKGQDIIVNFGFKTAAWWLPLPKE
jgi:hypothetical protein